MIKTDLGTYEQCVQKDERRRSDFTKDELDLLAHGFGFFVQEFDFGLNDDGPEHKLLARLFRLSEESK